jgi:hypothetical protein
MDKLEMMHDTALVNLAMMREFVKAVNLPDEYKHDTSVLLDIAWFQSYLTRLWIESIGALWQYQKDNNIAFTPVSWFEDTLAAKTH